MRVVVDTNVFVSGVFFGGVPGLVLGLWKSGEVELVMTEAILSEYEDVVRRLAARYHGVDPDPIVGLVAKKAFLSGLPLFPARSAPMRTMTSS